MDLFPEIPYVVLPNLWQRIAYEPGEPVRHVHACPECYEDEACTENCTIEPDLEREDGTPAGSHLECSRCCPRELPPPPPWMPPPEQLALPGVD